MYEFVVLFAILISVLYFRVAYGISYTGGVPRLGKPGVIGYLQVALRFVLNAESVLQEGRDLFSGGPFVVPTLGGSIFVLGQEYLAQMRTANDDVFNQPLDVDEDLQLRYTMDALLMRHPYHTGVLRTDITRAIPSYIPEIFEESTMALEEAFSPIGDAKSKNAAVLETMTYMIARISNRIIVGTEIGRNNKFIHAIVNFAETIPLTAPFITWSPVFLRPMVYFVLSSIFGGKKEALKYLRPLVRKYRLDTQFQLMDETPNTVLEILVHNSLPNESDEGIAMRAMMVNFASIHTSSIFVTHALFELALLPRSDIDCIRAEILDAIDSEGGWNKNALLKFRKLDSTLREVGRLYGIFLFALPRLAIHGYQLADGSTIPPGYRTAIDMTAIHYNPETYPDPHRCDLFRFSKLRDGEADNSKYGFATIDNDYLPFGAGRHACPGRFFAAMELKVILAQILLNYDFELPPGITNRPKNIVFNAKTVPHPKGQLVFTKRKTDMPCHHSQDQPQTLAS